ncbi:hypothetical protein DL764_010338 [Monosporascus ibericus]|uniref:Uncharacterized protein n=1 Tax=Monosporascus ibericus TaxID=155417 RepID=A0A4V1X8Q4_9PEZI|nr:hypothetical protein DL764_010338 [Monosporascus ibericus]
MPRRVTTLERIQAPREAPTVILGGDPQMHAPVFCEGNDLKSLFRSGGRRSIGARDQDFELHPQQQPRTVTVSASSPMMRERAS